jgi:hypothetical protein
MLQKRNVPQLNDGQLYQFSSLVVVYPLAAELPMRGPWTVQTVHGPFFLP